MTLQTHAPENFRSRRWGPSGGSRVRRPGSEDPIGVSGNFYYGVKTLEVLAVKTAPEVTLLLMGFTMNDIRMH